MEDDPFGSDSLDYRQTIANWLIGDYVKGFSPEALDVFARLMTSDRIETRTKRELLFWKNCERTHSSGRSHSSRCILPTTGERPS